MRFFSLIILGFSSFLASYTLPIPAPFYSKEAEEHGISLTASATVAMICNHKTFLLVTCNRRQQHQQKNNNDINDHLKDNNQQVVHRSKKPTDSSNNSMKGVKTSILSGPLNSMTLEPLSLDEGDNRQQERKRRANGDMNTNARGRPPVVGWLLPC